METAKEQMRSMRERGMSYAAIGKFFSMSRQAAHQALNKRYRTKFCYYPTLKLYDKIKIKSIGTISKETGISPITLYNKIYAVQFEDKPKRAHLFSIGQALKIATCFKVRLGKLFKKE